MHKSEFSMVGPSIIFGYFRKTIRIRTAVNLEVGVTNNVIEIFNPPSRSKIAWKFISSRLRWNCVDRKVKKISSHPTLCFQSLADKWRLSSYVQHMFEVYSKYPRLHSSPSAVCVARVRPHLHKITIYINFHLWQIVRGFPLHVFCYNKLCAPTVCAFMRLFAVRNNFMTFMSAVKFYCHPIYWFPSLEYYGSENRKWTSSNLDFWQGFRARAQSTEHWALSSSCARFLAILAEPELSSEPVFIKFRV